MVEWGYKATLQSAAGALYQLSGSILHQDRWWQSSKNLTQRGTYPFIPPMVLQPRLSSMSSHGSHSVHCLMASMGWRHLHPPPKKCSPVGIHFHYTLPEVFTHPMWTLWWMSMGEVVTSHWSTSGKSCWPGIRLAPDHYILVVYSCFHSPWELAWLGWGWYIGPMLGRHPHTRECQSLMWWEEADFSGECLTVHVGLSLCRRVHQSQSDAPPHMPHLPTYL